MFEQPEAKRVRRSDLFDSLSHRSSSPFNGSAVEQELHSKQQLHFDLEFVDINHDGDTVPQKPELEKAQPSSTVTRPVAADDGPSEAFEFEFRLFSTSTSTSTGTKPRAHDDPARTNDAAPAQTLPPTTPPSSRDPKSGIHRIRIRSPTPLCSPASSGDGAFVVPHRPRAYYFTHATTAADQRAAYTVVAVSSAEVRERAGKTRWPGTSLPWRVTHVHLPRHSTPPLQLKRASPPSTIPDPNPHPPGRPAETKTKTKVKPRRTRAGKKRRLAIRAKYAATTARVETERAKRTRRNREKKVKRKEREKRAKEQEHTVAGD